MIAIVRLKDNKTEKRIFNVIGVFVYDDEIRIESINETTKQVETTAFPIGTWLAIFK